MKRLYLYGVHCEIIGLKASNITVWVHCQRTFSITLDYRRQLFSEEKALKPTMCSATNRSQTSWCT